MQTPPDKSMINNLSESNPIMFGKLSGRQEIRLKLKQSEGIAGPKVNTNSHVYKLQMSVKRADFE
jgi:hypothetical protein